MLTRDVFFWAACWAVVIGALVGFYWLETTSILYRSLAMVGALVVASGLASQTETGRSIVRLLGEARTEIQRVVWPTRAETTQTTLIVLALVALVMALIALFDTFLAWLFGLILAI